MNMFDSKYGDNLCLEYIYRYEGCWRAIMADADGVVLVYNPDAPSQDEQLLDWFDFFVKKNGLKDEQCMIFAHRSADSNERFRPRKQTFLSYYNNSQLNLLHSLHIFSTPIFTR